MITLIIVLIGWGTYQNLPQECRQRLLLFMLENEIYLGMLEKSTYVYFRTAKPWLTPAAWLQHSSHHEPVTVCPFEGHENRFSVSEPRTTLKIPTTVMSTLTHSGLLMDFTGRCSFFENRSFSRALKRAPGVGLLQFSVHTKPSIRKRVTIWEFPANPNK